MIVPKVLFHIDLKEGADGEYVKSELEKLSDNLHLQVIKVIDRKTKIHLVSGYADAATYERTFKAKLDFKVTPLVNPSLGFTEQACWVVKKPAKLPRRLRKHVKGIHLQEMNYVY